MIHVAVILPEYLRAILEGRKTAEARLARARVAPFGAVHVSDRVYFKQRSGGFGATATVGAVHTFEGLTPRGVERIRRRFDGAVLGSDEFWERKRGSVCATIIELSGVEAVGFGPDYERLRRRNPRSAWFVLDHSACVYPACASRRGARLVA